jgi:hypothetical protein
MEKLREYFAKRHESKETKEAPEVEDPVQFPTLDPQEEEQVYKTLGIDKEKVNGKNAKDVILGTLRSLKQVKVASAESAETIAADDSEMELVGTVRIKNDAGGDKFGTLKRNKKNELLLEELANADTGESSSDAYGTFRIHNDVPADDAFGTMKISDTASHETPLWMSKSAVRLFSAFIFHHFALLPSLHSIIFYFNPEKYHLINQLHQLTQLDTTYAAGILCEGLFTRYVIASHPNVLQPF